MGGGGFELLFLASESSMIKFLFLSYHHNCSVENGLEKGKSDGQEQVQRLYSSNLGKRQWCCRLSFLLFPPFCIFSSYCLGFKAIVKSS